MCCKQGFAKSISSSQIKYGSTKQIMIPISYLLPLGHFVLELATLWTSSQFRVCVLSSSIFFGKCSLKNTIKTHFSEARRDLKIRNAAIFLADNK